MTINDDNYTLISPPKSWDDPDRHFHETLRNPWYKTIFIIMQSIFLSTYEFFKNEGYDPALMPVTTKCISSPMCLGSDSEPVCVTMFGEDIYLSDSMQFNLEYLLRLGSKGVYFIMPTFRGENADNRHLNQFFHIEAELEGNLEDVLNLVNRLLMKCVENLIRNYSKSLSTSIGDIGHLINFLKKDTDAFPVITFRDAYRLLEKQKDCFTFLNDKPVRLSPGGEKLLLEKTDGIVWVTNFPRIGSPFYQMTALNGEYSLCADLLLGIGEVVGAGQRTSDADILIDELRYRKANVENYDWYIKMKREYPLKTSGFGMGLERLILWILNHDDIRDIPLMPRINGRIMTP